MAPKQGGPPAAGSSDQYRPKSSWTTSIYLCIWCLHLLQPLLDTFLFGTGHGALDERPLVIWDVWLLLPLIMTIILLEATTDIRQAELEKLVGVAHVLDFMIRIYRMPAVWDHEYWAMLTNLSFIICHSPLLKRTHGSLTVEANFVPIVRVQFGMFYMASAFWKLNTSFLNHTTSCGTVLVLEFLSSYTFFFPPVALDLVARAAPYITIALEAAIGSGMMHVAVTSKPKRWVRNATVLLATSFHVMIYMMPTNTAGGFSLDCMTRFILFFESTEVEAILPVIYQRHYWVEAIVSSLGLAVLRFYATSTPFDTGFFFAGLLAAFYVTIVVETRSLSVRFLPFLSSGVSYDVLFMSFVYSFILTILGVQQMGSPTKYSNLRSYNGGNHLLVPTGTLGESILYDGGLVQIVESNSLTLNLLLGYIPSNKVFQPRALDFLISTTRDDYITPLQFFPACMTNPRNAMIKSYRSANPTGSKLHHPIIVPISTVRKALKTANKQKENFYAKFADPTDTEGKRVVVIDSMGVCQVERKLKVASPCTGDELASRLLGHTNLSWQNLFYQAILDKILTPYPELVGTEEEICMA